MNVNSKEIPTRKEAEKDRLERERIRREVRYDAMTYGTDMEKRAAAYAVGGYGVEFIASRTGISKVQARALVLGEFSA